MRDELDPIAGNWYRHVEKDQTFKVVGIDEDRDVIQIQYFDGDVEEIETDAWSEMDLDVAEPPEDDDDSLDEADGARGALDGDFRESPVGRRKESEDWEDDDSEEDDDDWDDDEDSDDYHDSE
jgi:uncharacterized protein DUF6763